MTYNLNFLQLNYPDTILLKIYKILLKILLINTFYNIIFTFVAQKYIVYDKLIFFEIHNNQNIFFILSNENQSNIKISIR